MDIDRIDELCRKLSHTRLEIRSRALDNILFKLEKGLITISGINCCQNVLVNGIYDALTYVIDNNDNNDSWKLAFPPSLQNKHFVALLNVIKYIGKMSNLSNEVLDKLSLTLEKLYSLINYEMDSLVKDNIQSVISCLSGINSEKPKMSENYHDEDYGLPLSSLHQFRNKTEFMPSNDEYNELLKTSSFSGAGGILYSNFSYTGWKIPILAITEIDEKFLFDVEVKLKLGHPGCEGPLWAILTDFPPQILIQRTGIIQQLLDIVGSVFFHDADMILAAGITPSSAIRWLESLLKKCIEGFLIQIDGSSSSAVPETLTSDVEYNNDKTAPSLASQMAKAIYSMRIPVHNGLNSSDEISIGAGALSYEQRKIQNLGTVKPPLPPTPSLAGFAFSCCAACLPILQTKDLSLCTSVLTILLSALPYIKEPSLDSNLKAIDCNRLQHLMSRVEQMVKYFESSLSFRYSFQNDSDNGSINLDEMEKASFDSLLVRVIIEIVNLIPLATLSNSSTSPDSNFKILIGPKTLDIIKKTIILTLHDPYPDMKLFTNVDVLMKALSAVDVASFTQIKYTDSIISINNTMVANLEELVRIRQDSHNDHVVKLEREIKVIEDLVSDAMRISCLLDDDVSIGLDISSIGLIRTISVIVIVSYESCFANYDVSDAMSVILRLVSCGNIKAKYELIEILAYYLCDPKLRTLGTFTETENLLNALGLGFKDPKAIHVASALKQALSNSNFVYGVLMYGILSNIDTKDPSSKQGIDSTLLLLNIILASVLHASPTPNVVNWCNSLCPLKIIQWRVEMGCGLGSKIVEGYVQDLPSAISSFIELLEDACAAADPNATTYPSANEQYNKALMLGLFSISPTIRNRCCLTLQGLGLGLNTQNYRLISSLNTFCPFPAFGEINPKISNAQEIIPNANNSAFSSFKFMDLKKLSDIAFGTQNIVSALAFIQNANKFQIAPVLNISSPNSIDASIRISALRQMQEMLTENLLVMQNKLTRANSGSPNLVVSLSLEYDWCVAILSLTLMLLRDIRLRLDCSGNNESNNVDVVTLCIEASNMVRLLMLTIPALKRKVKLSLIEEKELGMGLGLGLSVHPIISLLTYQDPNPNPNPSEIETKVWTKLQLTLAHLLYLLITDSEGWKIDSNTPDDYQQIFMATSNHSGNQFTIPSFLQAFMNDIENVNTSLNSTCNPNPTYGSISCILKSNKNASICREVVESSLDLSPSLSLDTLTNIIFSIQDILDEMSNQNYDNNSRCRVCLSLLNCITTTLPLSLTLTPNLLVNNSMSIFLDAIFNRAPKNHEDFLTLNLALEYVLNCLNAIYAGLSLNNGQMISEEHNFIYSLNILFNKAGPNPLIGMLADPNPAIYFKSYLYHNPGSNPNKSTITLPLSQSDINSMQNIFTQTQSLILEMLKSVISICVTVKSDNPNMKSLPLEFDYTLISTLVKVVTTENFSSNLRNLAASGVEGVLVFKGCWDIDNKDGLGVGFGLEFEFNIFNDSTRNSYNNISKSSIDMMLRVVKLLRVPDSLLGSGVVISTLRILTLYLKYILASGEGLGLGLDWKWLVKLCYDRRAEVRSICLELIDLILTIENTIDNCRLDFQVSPSNNNEESEEYISWPPYDTLKLIILDKNEAGSVRVMASKILVKNNCSSDSGMVGQVIMSLYDTLDLSSPRANISTIRESLSIIALLLSSSTTSSETLKCLVSMKVLSQIIAILNPNFPGLMQQLAKSRVGIIHSNEALFTFGWELLWREYLKENEHNLVLSFAIVAKVIVLLSKITNENGNNYFTQCVTLTPIIPNSILAMSNLTNSLSGDYVSFNYAYSSLADLVTQAISLQINDEKKVIQLGSGNSQSSPVTLIESIAYQLQLAGALIEETLELGLELRQSSVFLITSTTRLLSHILSIEFWKNSLKIRVGQRSIKNILLSSLISLKSLLSSSPPSATLTSLLLQVDVTIALLLQKSDNDNFSVIDEDVDESFYSDIVISNIRNINDCCDSITNASQANSTINEMKSSLKTLRKKMGRDKVDTYRSKVRSYTYNQNVNESLNANKSFIINDSNRLILWQSLLVLTNALADSSKLRELASELDLAFTLSKLFRYCPYWAATSGSAFYTHENSWYPSNNNLSSAALALALAFCHRSDGNKNILATTGELILTISNQGTRLKSSSEGSKGKVIHQLLSMGLSKGLGLQFRCLALELLGVSISSVQPNPVLQKMCLTSTLIAALRKSLHSSTSDPDILVFLLDAFTSIITSKNTKEIHSSTNVIKENLEDIDLNAYSSEMSIPTLFQWIWDVSTNVSPVLAASLLRCVGRMGNPFINLSPSNLNNNFNEALHRRLLSNVTDADTLAIVTTACNSQNAVLQEVGMMTLWSILHNSEQARAHFKKSGLNLDSPNSNSRSSIALNLLMN